MIASAIPYVLMVGVTALAVAFAWAVSSAEKHDSGSGTGDRSSHKQRFQ